MLKHILRLNGEAGVFGDYTTGKIGLYESIGISIGIDLSAGGVAGVIYEENSLERFQGSSWSSNVGFLFFSFTSIYDMDNNWIGNAVGIDGGPLPISTTVDFSRTTIHKTIKSQELRKKIYDKLWDIYYRMLSAL